MTMSQHINYVTTDFPHKIPTLVHGEPSYNDLKKIKTKVRVNASSMETNLGDGDHGYLFLGLIDAEYITIPGVHTATYFPSGLLPFASQQPARLSRRYMQKNNIKNKFMNTGNVKTSKWHSLINFNAQLNLNILRLLLMMILHYSMLISLTFLVTYSTATEIYVEKTSKTWKQTY